VRQEVLKAPELSVCLFVDGDGKPELARGQGPRVVGAWRARRGGGRGAGSRVVAGVVAGVAVAAGRPGAARLGAGRRPGAARLGAERPSVLVTGLSGEGEAGLHGLLNLTRQGPDARRHAFAGPELGDQRVDLFRGLATRGGQDAVAVAFGQVRLEREGATQVERARFDQLEDQGKATSEPCDADALSSPRLGHSKALDAESKHRGIAELCPKAALVDLFDQSKQCRVDAVILGGERAELREKGVVGEGVETCHDHETSGGAVD
jgi:hypothetical protein